MYPPNYPILKAGEESKKRLPPNMSKKEWNKIIDRAVDIIIIAISHWETTEDYDEIREILAKNKEYVSEDIRKYFKLNSTIK